MIVEDPVSSAPSIPSSRRTKLLDNDVDQHNNLNRRTSSLTKKLFFGLILTAGCHYAVKKWNPNAFDKVGSYITRVATSPSLPSSKLILAFGIALALALAMCVCLSQQRRRFRSFA